MFGSGEVNMSKAAEKLLAAVLGHAPAGGNGEGAEQVQISNSQLEEDKSDDEECTLDVGESEAITQAICEKFRHLLSEHQVDTDEFQALDVVEQF